MLLIHAQVTVIQLISIRNNYYILLGITKKCDIIINNYRPYRPDWFSSESGY